MVVSRDSDEEVNSRGVRVGRSGGREEGDRRRRKGRSEEGGAEAGEIVPRFDEFVEEVVVG